LPLRNPPKKNPGKKNPGKNFWQKILAIISWPKAPAKKQSWKLSNAGLKA
jgi:hypothetical protein